jgi:hypothetical protein
MRAHNTHLLQVQLTEAEKRNIKTLVVSQGLTLREATLQAFQAWAAQLQSGAPNPRPERSPLASADSQKPGQPKRAVTPRQDERPAGGAPPLAPDGGSIPSFGVAARALLHRAAQVDWSKCPAVERLSDKAGHVWMVRGTDAPLAEVLQSVADGQPFLEIAEVFEITLQQLLEVLQFAAAGAAPARFATEAQRTRN